MKGNIVATIKFEDFARQWFKEYAEIKLKQRTVEGYHQIEKRIYKVIGHMRYVLNHSMRHLNASLLIAGVDVKTVHSCSGHSTLTTILQIYAHTFQAEQVRAMDTVANAISMKSSGQ